MGLSGEQKIMNCHGSAATTPGGLDTRRYSIQWATRDNTRGDADRRNISYTVIIH